MKELTTNMSLLIVGACILSGAIILSNALTQSSQEAGEQVIVREQPEGPQLLSYLELQDYLGLSDEQIEKVLPKNEGDGVKSQIPYVKIGYEYYFPVKAVDKWLAETEAATFR
ncbi:hypothetical protein GLW04_02515 [Halobacillus litoralis]|uniref:Uncharacterized protein n=1 Tax=Halobacillus litoralis TaxID=45668 RepID=A0A845DZ68_9BACI|nr:hypothetical protein [Halobacillus litoralis]MYL18744.1 hypothetical protein [Halobacillus litoralis]MYL39185.1 hypothetical protein [Halobacillus litoralis]